MHCGEFDSGDTTVNGRGFRRHHTQLTRPAVANARPGERPSLPDCRPLDYTGSFVV